jgi:hypothetical protein
MASAAKFDRNPDTSGAMPRFALRHYTVAEVAPAAQLGTVIDSARGQRNHREKEGSMARKRCQQGHIFQQGEVWYVRCREDVIVAGKEKPVRVLRNTRLGTKRELPTKRLAERKAEQVLSRINGLDCRPGRVATFEELVERFYRRGCQEKTLPSPTAGVSLASSPLD